MAIERIVDTSVHADDTDEQIIEVTLRPQRFAEYIGQEHLKKNLKLAIEVSQLTTCCSMVHRDLARRPWRQLLRMKWVPLYV